MNKLIKKRVFEAVDKYFKNNNKDIGRQEIISIIKINSLVSRAIVDVITMNGKSYILDLVLHKSGVINIYNYELKGLYIFGEGDNNVL